MTAATELFRDRGFRETSLGDIGAAAGVSGPAIYRYFKSKGELLSILIEEASITWRETVDDVLNEDTPPMVTLERLIDAAIVLQLKNGNLRDVFVKEYRSLDDDARRRVARIERVRMAEWVHLLCEVRPGLSDEEARAAVTMVDGMLRSITSLDGADQEQLARVMKDMVFGGLLSVGVPRPARGGPGVTDEPDEEEFRAEVLAFFKATLPPKGAAVETGGTGVTRAVAFQRQLAEAGLAGITWPVEYGGRGLPGRFQRIFDREAKAFQVPPRARDRARHVRPHAARARQRGAEAGADPPAPARRAHLVRAVQRARCGLGPLQRADPGPPRWRRVRARRAEGVDLGRPAQRLRRLPDPQRPGAPQARGDHDAHRRHALAGHHRAAVAPDDG